MALALVSFVLGTPLYRKDSFITNSENPMGLVLRRLWSGRHCTMGRVALLGWMLMPLLIAVSVLGAFMGNMLVTVLNLVLGVIAVGCLCVAHRDNAWLGKDDVTQSLDCVPTLLIGNIIFNIQYNTMASFFYSQSCQMDTRLGSGANAPQLNGAVFNLADCAAIVIFTPLLDKICIPCLERALGCRVTMNAKIYFGIAIASGSQLVAAFLDYARMSSLTLDIGSFCAPLEDGTNQHVPMSAISAFWMGIPYAMVGIGEILVNPVLQHHAYEGAAPSMRSLVQAFNLFTMMGLPSVFSAALNEATATFTPNNLDDGNLPVVYYINVAIGVVGCGLYYLLSKSGDSTPKTNSKESASPVASHAKSHPTLPISPQNRDHSAGTKQNALGANPVCIP